VWRQCDTTDPASRAVRLTDALEDGVTRVLRSWPGRILCSAVVLAALSGPRLSARQDWLAGAPAQADRERARALARAINERLDHVPGEVLIKFRAGTDTATQSAIMALAPAPDGGRRSRWVGDLAVVDTDPDAPAAAVAERLSREPEVEYAQPNHFIRLAATTNDPGLSQQWNLSTIEVPRAWDINPGGADVLVAVVDSGITTATATVGYRLWTGREFENVAVPYRINPDLDASRFAPGIDTTFTRLIIQGPATQPVLDTEGHGTHVAGTILQATNNSLGFAGIAYAARLMPVKSCFSYWDFQFYLSAIGQPGFVDPSFGGGCATADVVAGIRAAADAGAKVINLSLGGPGQSPAYSEALNYAVQRGAFIAMAVGNEFEDGNPVEYPAAYGPQVQGAMSVGAVGRTLARAFYSNTGSHLEIVAPGGDSRASGASGLIVQTGLFEPDFDSATVIVPRFDRYTESLKQGTSMATPHVVGVAALAYSQGITNPAAIEAAITQFARDLGDPGTDPQYGAGMIDARATLRGLGLAR
jgi:serine protease